MFFDCKYPMLSVYAVSRNNSDKIPENLMSNRMFSCFALTYYEKCNADISFCGKTMHLDSGCIALTAPNTKYKFTAYSECESITVFFNAISNMRKCVNVYAPVTGEMFGQMFNNMLAVYEHDIPERILKCNEIINRIFFSISLEENEHHAPSSSNYAKVAASIIDYELSNSQFSIENLADSLGISDTYFRVLFTREYGITPKEYQIKKRVKLAQSIIENNFVSVSDTAKRCGYEDVKYFSTSFKKQFGMSPIHYFEQTRGNNEK